MFCTAQGSWPSPVNRNWSEARQEIQARLYWGPCYSVGSKNKQQVPLLAPQGAGASLLLIWGGVMGVQRHYFANKVISTQSYGFSSSHVWMWELDYKDSWEPKIDAFGLWCWRRLLGVPWTVRRSNQSVRKEISPDYSLEGLMLKLKLQYFGHPV